jgi:ABC-type transporter Mla MlaB component
MPVVVTNDHLQDLVKSLKNSITSNSLRLLDFSKSRHIMLDAHHHFLQLTELVSDPGKNLKLIGIGKRLKRCLRASRVMDLLDPSCQSGSLSTLASASIDLPELFSCASYVSDKGSLIFMEGVVNSSNLRSVGFGECLQQTARDRTCVLDLRQVIAIESSGIAELYANIESDPHLRANILLAGASYQTRQMFRLADLAWPDNFLSDNDLMDWLAGEPEYVGE